MNPGPDVRRVAATVRRKLSKSMEQRGWAGTLAHAAALPLRRLTGAVDPAGRARRRESLEFDRTHGVDTAGGRDPGWMAEIASPSWRHGAGYDPVPEDVFRRALDAIPAPLDGWTFVDFGAGKGKALLLASERPFGRIVGVEYAPPLARAARENAERFAGRGRGAAIEVVEGDALDFPIPGGPLVLFFHHPFEAPVFDRVLERIVAAAAAEPRPVWLVYHDPRCGDRVERAGFRARTRLAGGCQVFEFERGAGVLA